MVPCGIPGLPHDPRDLPMTLGREARGSQKKPGAPSRGREEPDTKARREARKGHKAHKGYEESY